MRTYTAIVLVGTLLVLAMVPWIVSSCASQPLLPDEFHQERESYTATVSAAQDATIEAMRKAPSTPKVLIIGTVRSASRTPTPTSPSATRTPSTATLTSSPTSGEAVPGSTMTVTPPRTPTLPSSSIIIVNTVVAAESPTTTPRRIIVRSQGSPKVPTETLAETPAASPTQSGTATLLPALPSGLIDTEDVITEEMLTEQVKQDADDSSLSDLTIQLTPDGINAIALATIFPGIKRRIEASGTFAVENYSLVVRVSSIQLDGLDVTERYRGQLESSVNSSLYRLLPQRYVQSYELADGEVRVYSKVRP